MVHAKALSGNVAAGNLVIVECDMHTIPPEREGK